MSQLTSNLYVRCVHIGWVSLVAQTVKNLPAMQETQVLSLSWKNPLEKGMATHSNILDWRIPGTEECGGLQSMGSQRVKHNWVTSLSFYYRSDLVKTTEFTVSLDE